MDNQHSPSTLNILNGCVDEFGWGEDTQIVVLCDFIDELGEDVKQKFQEFLAQRLQDEQEMSNEPQKDTFDLDDYCGDIYEQNYDDEYG